MWVKRFLFWLILLFFFFWFILFVVEPQSTPHPFESRVNKTTAVRLDESRVQPKVRFPLEEYDDAFSI